MIDLIRLKNGTMTLDDLRNYTVEVKPHLSITYRDFRLFAPEAPSSGAVLLSMLKTMDQYPVQDLADSNLTTHRFVEAMKFAYGARQQLGDPAFIRHMETYQQQMLSDDQARQIRHRILDNQTQPVEAYNPESVYAAESEGTSHIVTADSSGLTVTSTTTINLLFGARIMTPDTGIIL
jgi:gamma-glutamyltranspeptidase/glutathione hydrolase